jgi:spindle assembly abnormal protein 6
MKERLSTKSEVIRKQEALVVELRNKQLEHDKQLQIVQANLSDSKNEYSSLHREYEKAKEKLTESANIIATNQEVITWLNREISRYQLNGGIPLLGAESFDDKVHHICLFYNSYSVEIHIYTPIYITNKIYVYISL